MTCIAALVDDDGSVWVGGDAAGTDIETLQIQTGLETKVWKAGGLIFGGCGSFRVMQLLRWQMNVPTIDEDQDPMAYMTGILVDTWRSTLLNGGALTVWDETSTEEIDESGYLVAFQGRLFEVYSDFGIGEYEDGYAAIGCGGAFALGSLHATEAYDIPAQDRIMAALKAAERFSAGVRGPFTIERMDLTT